MIHGANRLVLFVAAVVIVGGVTAGVEMVHRSDQLSSETTQAAAQNAKDKKLHISLHSQTAVTPHKSGSMSHTTISTSKGCTKTVTTKSTPTSNGATENITSTSVKCTSGGSSSSTSVSVNSNSNQSSSTGSSSSGQSGSATNVDNENTNIHISD